MNPYTAISLIFSVFKECAPDQNKAICEVIFNPLMISYPRKVSEYLQKNKDKVNKEKQKYIDNLIENLEKYHQALKLSKDLKEITINPSQHFEYRRYHQQKMNHIYQKSRKESFLQAYLLKTLFYMVKVQLLLFRLRKVLLGKPCHYNQLAIQLIFHQWRFWTQPRYISLY
ncbi:hypothetical protein L2Z44_12475 [Acinetobacter baumannii]|uniref:hypothetical protein n=1 Tax=Acinetobacter baumannii TaxID=470 RepID=UPI001F09850D|nr:hypothetical protein [Acinetobacter baumannii]UMO42024.1 hypothetical protein L2Z44_12475 [Acinetobacter baumannii]